MSVHFDWVSLETGALRVGLLDEANFAREKQHAAEHGYSFMCFRGHQSTGDAIMHRVTTGVTSAPIETPVGAPVPASAPKSSSRSRTLSLFSGL